MLHYKYLISYLLICLISSHVSADTGFRVRRGLRNRYSTNSSQNYVLVQLKHQIEFIKKNQYLNLDKAFITLDDAKLLTSQVDDKTKEIELLIIESELLCRINQLPDAFLCAKNAIHKSEKLDNKLCLANSYLAMANVYISLNDHEKAYTYCTTARSTLDKLDNKEGLRKYYTYIGSIYNRTNSPVKAFTAFEKALNYAERLRNNIYIAIACSNLGITAYRTSNYVKGQKYMDKAICLCKQNNYHSILATTYIDLANSMLSIGEIDKTIIYYEKAIKIAERFHLMKPLIRAHLMTGLYYLSLNEHETSIANASKTYELSVSMKNFNETIQSSYLLSDNYQAIGKVDSCIYYLKTALEYKDSLNMRNNINKLTILKYEYENREQKKEAKYKIITLVLSISVIVLILLLILTGYLLKSGEIQMKISSLETKSAELKQEPESRIQELGSKLMHIISLNNTVEALVEKICSAEENIPKRDERMICDATGKLKDLINGNELKEFKQRFNEAYPEFMNRLIQQFPNLTPKEKDLCIYLKLNTTTAEIASLLNISIEEVVINKYRLQKKMGLNIQDTSITKFIDQL